MSQSLNERFQRVCRDFRSSPAVHDLSDGRSLLFADLHAQADAIGRAFEQLRVGPGTTIVALVGNRPVFFPLLAACMSARAALIPLGETTGEEAASVIASSEARIVVTDRTLPLDHADAIAIGKGVQALSLHRRDGAPPFGESVVLKLTSGSTDIPKAAVSGIDHLINDGRHVIEAMGIERRDINFACIPLSHSYALGNIAMPLLLQGTPVVLRQSFNPLQLQADIESTDATVFAGVPFMFDRVRRLSVDRLPASLRLLVTAGARIDPETVGWFHRHLGRKIHSFYGSSETGGIAYDDSDELADPLHVGRPMPETTVSVRDPDHAGAGRLFVSGTAVAAGYAHARTSRAGGGFADGGFVTDDLGYVDPSGHLVLTGRVSALINVAGLKVDPAEVERVLMELPGVSEALVMGASCDRRGEQLVAFVVASEPLTSVDLRQRCARTLSPHKIPRQFLFLDRLPVDARGKMDRRALEAMAADAPA